MLLASVVTYFAINVVSTRVQEENLHLTKQHLWHNAAAHAGDANYSIASLMVINTGGRDIVIDKLAVRGQESPWNDQVNSKFVLYAITTDPIASDMPFVGNLSATDTNILTLGGKDYTFHLAVNDLVLPSGNTIVLYIVNPDSITINDIGLTVSITLYTAQAMYYREANVQAYYHTTNTQTVADEQDPEEPQAADITVSDAEAYYGADRSQGALVVTNNEDAAITITGVTLNTHAGTGLYDAVGAFGAVADLTYISTLNGAAHDGHNLASVNSVVIQLVKKQSYTTAVTQA